MSYIFQNVTQKLESGDCSCAHRVAFRHLAPVDVQRMRIVQGPVNSPVQVELVLATWTGERPISLPSAVLLVG